MPKNAKNVTIINAGFAPPAKLPLRASSQSNGYDLFCYRTVVLPPGEVHILDTKVILKGCHGLDVQIRSRSGLATKGIIVANSPGTIDPDYQGTIGVILANIGKEPYRVFAGDRIAQMVFVPVEHPNFITQGFPESEGTPPPGPSRGTGGFGSTGV